MDDFAARCQAVRARVEAEPLRRPPFNFAAVDGARELDARAQRLLRVVDEIVIPFTIDDEGRVLHDTESPEARRRASLTATACDLLAQADALVPVEYR